jgi:hypothetical protein
MNCKRMVSTWSSHMDWETKTSKVASDMIAFCTGGRTVLPFASETEVVGALPANVIVTEVIIESLGVGERLCAVEPLALVKRRGVERKRLVMGARGGRGRAISVRRSWGRHLEMERGTRSRFLVESGRWPAVDPVLGSLSHPWRPEMPRRTPRLCQALALAFFFHLRHPVSDATYSQHSVRSSHLPRSHATAIHCLE